MHRRNFLKKTLIAGTTVGAGFFPSVRAESRFQHPPFKMKFSPDFGLFADVGGADLVDQLKWAHDQGFWAWENTGLKFHPIAEQERISKAIQSLGMEFGQFVGTLTFKDVTFAGRDDALRDEVLKDIRNSVEIAKRMNTKIVHNVLGMSDPKLPYDFQMANAVDLLKRVVEIYEPLGIMTVIEPMNHKIDHPGMFLHTVPQAYSLVKSVGSPNLKILYDIYHVQIQEGNLLPTLDYVWEEIGYFQMGDTPGRKEPTSGEINYRKVLQHIYDKGYRGFVGLEHGTSKPGKEGEMATLEAYYAVDPK